MPHKTANDRFASRLALRPACALTWLVGGVRERERDTPKVSGAQQLRGATCDMGRLHKLTQLCASRGDDGHMGN